jgi:hypothetical protein
MLNGTIVKSNYYIVLFSSWVFTLYVKADTVYGVYSDLVNVSTLENKSLSYSKQIVAPYSGMLSMWNQVPVLK